jgi:hypothetical protein
MDDDAAFPTSTTTDAFPNSATERLAQRETSNVAKVVAN